MIDYIGIIKSRTAKLKNLKIYDELTFQELMKEKINNNVPYMVGKLGGFELNALQCMEFNRSDKYKESMFYLYQNAGVFPNDISMLKIFCKEYINTLANIDIILTYQKQYEKFMINKYAKNLEGYIENFIYTAWDCNYPWTKYLSNKKVLVVHPFAKTIMQQYTKREVLFKNKDVLPKFELIVYKAVQSMNGNDNGYSNWLDALNHMEQEILKIDFDVALVGCGAYGLPLCSRIKSMGKIAVHMGGDLQMLFGIKGKRWDDSPIASSYYNQYWVYPSEEDRPKGYKNIEDGCYW